MDSEERITFYGTRNGRKKIIDKLLKNPGEYNKVVKKSETIRTCSGDLGLQGVFHNVLK